MKKTRELTLIKKENLSENLYRLVLSGAALSDFPENQESGYVKFLFSPDDGEALKPELLDDSEYFKATRKRTFTIRAYDANTQQLHIDGVCHSFGDANQGPANRWIENANVGDALFTAGPGDKKLINFDADWYFFAGDMTALPAIEVNLQQLPKSARGIAVIEVISNGDIRTLDAPEGIAIHWVVNANPKTPNSLLSDKVRSLDFLDGEVSVWLAGEFEMMRNLRRYFKQEKAVGRSKIYASSYWKINESDEGNKKAKRQDEAENPDDQI